MADTVQWSQMNLEDGKLVTVRELVINPKTCPFTIFDGTHYDNNGGCKCSDPVERQRMKDEWEYTDADFRAEGLIGYDSDDPVFSSLTVEEAQLFIEHARENWAVGEPINPLWHPVTRETCLRMEEE